MSEKNNSNAPPPGFGTDFGPLGTITPPFHACRLIEAAADDALKRHQAYWEQLYAEQEIKPKVSFRDLQFYCWPQVWGSTTCGFPGIGGAAMTSALTCVFIESQTGAAAVYHAGRFAYFVKGPSDRFWNGMNGFNLPGAADSRRGLEREP